VDESRGHGLTQGVGLPAHIDHADAARASMWDRPGAAESAPRRAAARFVDRIADGLDASFMAAPEVTGFRTPAGRPARPGPANPQHVTHAHGGLHSVLWPRSVLRLRCRGRARSGSCKIRRYETDLRDHAIKRAAATCPTVPDSSDQREFTLRALISGLLMCVVLGAANAYLGLRAGMTIAATYPAAVIGMAVLRLVQGQHDPGENFAGRSARSANRSPPARIFTIPAFVIPHLWKFDSANLWHEYLVSSALMILGGLLGIMFRHGPAPVMVEDPFAAVSRVRSRPARSTRRGRKGPRRRFNCSAPWASGSRSSGSSPARASASSRPERVQPARRPARESFVRLGLRDDSPKVAAGGIPRSRRRRDASPIWASLHHRAAELGALNFAGGLLAWGCSCRCSSSSSARAHRRLSWGERQQREAPGHRWWSSCEVHRAADRGGRHAVGATFTLYRMRKNLVGDSTQRRRLKKSATRGGHDEADRDGPVPQGRRLRHPRLFV